MLRTVNYVLARTLCKMIDFMKNTGQYWVSQKPVADMTLLYFNATVGSLICTLVEGKKNRQKKVATSQ